MTARMRVAWPLTLALFALLYAYDEWEAISNLVLVPSEVAASNEFYGLDSPVPWGGLVAGAALPPLVFATALALGRRRTLLERIAVLAAGLAVVAAVTLSITAYVRAGGL